MEHSYQTEARTESEKISIVRRHKAATAVDAET
jgi:hypothetical protein